MLDLIPENLDFGKDIKKIIFNDDTVIKFFRDKNGFEKTIEFSNFMDNNIYFPKIIEQDYKNFKLIQENCGNLLSLNNLPNNWEYQLKNICNIFKNKKIYILDLRFLPYTPFVINNFCVKNSNIKIIDLTLFRKRPEWYIDYRIKFLILQIKLYKKIKKFIFLLFVLHFFSEIYRILIDIIEIILFRDISIFYETKNIRKYYF